MFNWQYVTGTPPNEKISHRWQGRTWLTMDVLKSCESGAPERPAVGCIGWLDDGSSRNDFGQALQREPIVSLGVKVIVL
jgi:hypothetical protein